MSVEAFIANFIDATDFQIPVTITLDSELRALAEWDSLAALGVIVMFDMEYQKTITGDDLHEAVTVGDLYRWVN
ncbi:phosphopantetheine-binding protein [Pseudomonas chlororaphis subsp. aurantiaca]|uniref:phosphopantetheine-binding protein n=1 Tax=Pseudomonas chlororaphis TaxID=587753 RepID=UPI0027DB6BF3|nr:phosphopantetheine-binding protein [Pseudomonas chlororaphis]WMI97606.1 phosphopantetheine-binding protein [Pseudomonas chlororaphis subsp. aurantiaca]